MQELTVREAHERASRIALDIQKKFLDKHKKLFDLAEEEDRERLWELLKYHPTMRLNEKGVLETKIPGLRAFEVANELLKLHFSSNVMAKTVGNYKARETALNGLCGRVLSESERELKRRTKVLEGVRKVSFDGIYANASKLIGELHDDNPRYERTLMRSGLLAFMAFPVANAMLQLAGALREAVDKSDSKGGIKAGHLADFLKTSVRYGKVQPHYMDE